MDKVWSFPTNYPVTLHDFVHKDCSINKKQEVTEHETVMKVFIFGYTAPLVRFASWNALNGSQESSD